MSSETSFHVISLLENNQSLALLHHLSFIWNMANRNHPQKHENIFIALPRNDDHPHHVAAKSPHRTTEQSQAKLRLFTTSYPYRTVAGRRYRALAPAGIE